jgi:hypothetical protein
MLLPGVARADLTVDVTFDGSDGECATDCTLREAVGLIPESETIHLGDDEYLLTLGQLELDGSFTIDGEGARDTTIRGDGSDRVGYVGNFSTITLTDLTVRGGFAGPSASPNPSAGGAFAVSVTGGNLRLFGVTVIDNAATSRGGAIASFGNLSFVESTATENSAGTSPGITGFGGAIYLAPGGDALLINSTLSNNQAVVGEGLSAGGAIFAEDDFTLEHVTIADNTALDGAGLYQDDDAGSPNVFDTLIAENTGPNCGGTMGIVEEDHNLADDESCEFDEAGDLEVTDAKIGELADNGGQTDTHGLLPDSPALDTARPLNCPQTDQRLVARPQPGPCSIGAFEGVVGIDFTVTANHDNGNGVCSDNPTDCTLRDALTEAGENDAVILPPGTYAVEDTALPLEGDTIVGTGGARDTIIDADGDERVLHVTAGSNEVSGVTITGGGIGGEFTGVGGGVLLRAPPPAQPPSLLMSNVRVHDNATNEGGGIANVGGTLDLIRSTVSANDAAATFGGAGGGLYLVGGVTRLTNVTVSGNTASNPESFDSRGGGIFIAGGTLTTNNVTIADNQAGSGSGIHRETVPASTVTLTNTIVADTVLFALCAGGPFAGDHNVFDHSSCGSPAREPLLGGLANNGGQTNTHAIGATSPAVDGGVNCDSTDQRGQPRKRACDIGAYEYQGNLPPSGGGGPSGPPPPPPGDDDEELPPPVAGKNVNALPKSGTVKIKLPGSDTFVELVEGQQIPVGTIVDARNGHVTLVAAGGGEAEFYGGVFKIGQTKGAKPLTTLSLTEKLACPKKGNATTAAKKKKKRRLWGNGSGRFRTRGKHSAATVVGTKWLVEDKCRSTLTRVVRGKVRVRDFVKKKNVTVKAGKKYVARARP